MEEFDDGLGWGLTRIYILDDDAHFFITQLISRLKLLCRVLDLQEGVPEGCKLVHFTMCLHDPPLTVRILDAEFINPFANLIDVFS